MRAQQFETTIVMSLLGDDCYFYYFQRCTKVGGASPTTASTLAAGPPLGGHHHGIASSNDCHKARPRNNACAVGTADGAKLPYSQRPVSHHDFFWSSGSPFPCPYRTPCLSTACPPLSLPLLLCLVRPFARERHAPFVTHRRPSGSLRCARRGRRARVPCRIAQSDTFRIRKTGQRPSASGNPTEAARRGNCVPSSIAKIKTCLVQAPRQAPRQPSTALLLRHTPASLLRRNLLRQCRVRRTKGQAPESRRRSDRCTPDAAKLKNLPRTRSHLLSSTA